MKAIAPWPMPLLREDGQGIYPRREGSGRASGEGAQVGHCPVLPQERAVEGVAGHARLADDLPAVVDGEGDVAERVSQVPQVDGLAVLPERACWAGTDSHGAAGAGGADGLALIVDCGGDGVGVAGVRMGRVSWPESPAQGES